jgi:hypothetical protein
MLTLTRLTQPNTSIMLVYPHNCASFSLRSATADFVIAPVIEYCSTMEILFASEKVTLLLKILKYLFSRF